MFKLKKLKKIQILIKKEVYQHILILSKIIILIISLRFNRGLVMLIVRQFQDKVKFLVNVIKFNMDKEERMIWDL